MTNEIDKEDGRTAALKWAHGGMWFLIWLGFGGCCYLANSHGDPVTVKVDGNTIISTK